MHAMETTRITLRFHRGIDSEVLKSKRLCSVDQQYFMKSIEQLSHFKTSILVSYLNYYLHYFIKSTM